jgi:hypothetical protein
MRATREATLSFADESLGRNVAAVMPPVPHPGSKRTLTGRVVTMDNEFTVHARGAIYLDANEIIAVQDASAPHPTVSRTSCRSASAAPPIRG